MTDTQTAPPGTDPFEPVREAYEEALAGWAQAMQQTMGGPDLAAASGNLLSGYVAMQESLRATSQLTADALHLPSKDDLARIAELVVNVERKADELTDQLHALVAAAERPRPDGLASIEDRLAAIEAKLDALARDVKAPPPPAPPSEAPKPPAATTEAPKPAPAAGKAAPKPRPAPPRRRSPSKER